MTRFPRGTTYQTAPADLMYQRGVESRMTYNGLALNDKRYPDRIVVTRVSGIGDADVRDSRELNPDRHGETAGNALYGGRTITIQGYLQAGSIDGVRYQAYLLSQAFADISKERYLRFYFRDWLERWEASGVTSASIGDYVFDVGSSASLATSIGGMFISASAGTQIRMRLTRRTFRNHQHTMTFVPNATVTGSPAWQVGMIGRWLDANNHWLAGVNATNGLFVRKTVAGVNTTVAQLAITNSDFKALTAQYVRVSFNEDKVIVGLWLNGRHPDDGGHPNKILAYTMTGGEYAAFNSVGQVGLDLATHNIGWQFGDWEAAGIPGEPMVLCRKSASLPGDDEQVDGRYRRPFMITLRASDDAMVSKSVGYLAGDIALATLTFPGGGGGIAFPSSGGIVFGQSLGTARNIGFGDTQPWLRISGPCTNPAVVNLTNNSRVIIEGNIASGDWLDVDCRERTVVDSVGVNRYSMLARTNNWITLDPGDNAIATGADSNSPGTATCTMRWRHAIR